MQFSQLTFIFIAACVAKKFLFKYLLRSRTCLPKRILAYIRSHKEEHYERTLAYKRKEQARSKGSHVMLELLKKAKETGIQAKHVLFVTCFFSLSSLLSAKSIGIGIIDMIMTSFELQLSIQTRILARKKPTQTVNEKMRQLMQ